MRMELPVIRFSNDLTIKQIGGKVSATKSLLCFLMPIKNNRGFLQEYWFLTV